MRLALLGYGRMGKAIEKIALSRGHAIVSKIDRNYQEGKLDYADVAINFSTPSSAVGLIKKAFQKKIPVVSGTTGWLDTYHEIVSLCQKKQTAFLYASNFSIGVNLYFKINEVLAEKLFPNKGYKAKIEEIHHVHKLDKPSGTAITLAEAIIAQSEYTQWDEKETASKTLAVQSKRMGEVVGKHQVDYESNTDKISIIHEAKDRSGFALGAVIAAEWILGKQGSFSMKDVLNL